MGPSETVLVLITSMLLPGIVILAVAFFSGSLERGEQVKYMAVIPEPLPWEREPDEEEEPERGEDL